MKIDLHGYHPSAIVGPPLAKLIEQAWEMGADRICFIHGHGRARGLSPGFVNTNTGYFGLSVRRELRSNKDLRRWIKYTTLDWGATTVKLKANPNPARTALDLAVLPERSYARRMRRTYGTPNVPLATSLHRGCFLDGSCTSCCRRPRALPCSSIRKIRLMNP